MSRSRWLSTCLAVLLAGACVPAFAGSLWPECGGSLFTDNKAYKVGDIVTVVVDESSELSNSAGSSLSKAGETEGQIETLDIPKGAGAAKVFTGDMPKVKWGSKRTFDGTGSYSLKGSMKTHITALVVDVLPNGNLLIEGSHLRQSVGEKIVVRISGIIRPEDISADNTVSSTAVAQGKIVFETSGPIARSSRRGFLNRIVDFLWPF